MKIRFAQMIGKWYPGNFNILKCPSCLRGNAGEPYVVQYDPGLYTEHYQCKYCGADWSIDRSVGEAGPRVYRRINFDPMQWLGADPDDA